MLMHVQYAHIEHMDVHKILNFYNFFLIRAYPTNYSSCSKIGPMTTGYLLALVTGPILSKMARRKIFHFYNFF